MWMFTFVFAIVSCQKTQNAPVNTNLNRSAVSCGANSRSQIIPEILQVPEGNKLALQAYANGVQIYQVQRSTTDSNEFKWVFIAPSATLYSDVYYIREVGIHYAGPTWEFTKGFNKGEKTVAKKVKDTTMDATAIPWLLLKADSSLSSTNNKVTYVQRICTTGGLAPVTRADEEHLGQYDSIPYTATYLFYTAKK